ANLLPALATYFLVELVAALLLDGLPALPADLAVKRRAVAIASGLAALLATFAARLAHAHVSSRSLGRHHPSPFAHRTAWPTTASAMSRPVARSMPSNSGVPFTSSTDGPSRPSTRSTPA